MKHSKKINFPIRRISKTLQKAWELLCSPEFEVALEDVSDSDASELRRAILRLTAYFDDSISNPDLGSLFDRTDENPLNIMRASIASAYNVKETIPGTTGTTGLNVPAVMALAGEDQELAIGRDCHVSVIAGLCLSGAKPVYLTPPFDAELGVLLPPTPKEVSNLLNAHPNIRALVVTMPTYHGLMGDVEGVVNECHRRGVLVMVDEAHGPHYHFLRPLGFPVAAEDAGADIISQSTHKVLSALNQGSLLHFNNADILLRYERFQSLGFQSTSFSYPILLSIENAIEQILSQGEAQWTRAFELARRLRDGASALPGVRILDEGVVDGCRVMGLDPTRVTLNLRGTGITGYQASDRLLRRKILVEMASPDVILFLVGPGTTEKQVSVTLKALEESLNMENESYQTNAFVPPDIPEQVLTPRSATIATNRERVPKGRAVGRICAETIGCYPPGQAIFVAGERVTQEGVEYLTRAVDSGAHLKRVQDDHFQTIEVVIET